MKQYSKINFSLTGWIMRLYHNVTQHEKVKQKLLCDLYCKFQHLDFCYTPNIYPANVTGDSDSNPENLDDKPIIEDNLLTESLGFLNLINKPTKPKSEQNYAELLIPKMWRYLPMADTTVADFLVRDVDSTILPREVAAVSQWLNQTTGMVHAMRDHPSHNGVMLAGNFRFFFWNLFLLHNHIKDK